MKTLELPNYPMLNYKYDILSLSTKISVKLESDNLNKIISQKIISEYADKIVYNKKTIKDYIKNKKYPLKFLIFLNQKLSSRKIDNIIQNSNPTYICKWKKVSLPDKITPKLAYFVGYLQGDGSIESNQKRINFADEYKSQLERINDLCIELFNISGRLEEKRSALSLKPFYRLEIGSLVLNSYFHTIFGINRGIKNGLKIPTIFFKNKEILRWYIIGLFDADGTLPKNPEKAKQLFIDITLKDLILIQEIKKILESFGVKTLPIYRRMVKSPSSSFISKTYELRIRKREDILIFLKRVGFSHPDKRIRAKKILNMHL